MELYREDVSVIRRYSEQLASVSSSSLAAASIREGATLVELPAYRDVGIDVLDMASLSTTGTFKDWVACVSIATCLQQDVSVFVTQTSGNTGNALARYASNAGLRGVVLYPRDSRSKIRADIAADPHVAFVEVAATEEEIKGRLLEASADLNIPWIPIFEHQLEGNKIRAHFLAEVGAALSRDWDWHVQALSSAYGVFGFYQGLEELRRQGLNTRTPRVLGVQQEAVSPYFEALTGAAPADASVIEPTLFRRAPPESLLSEMVEICRSSGGTVLRLPNERYLELESSALNAYETSGITLARDASNGGLAERAGLYSLAGALDAIHRGLIEPGSRVLVAFTGAADGGVRGSFIPKLTADASNVRTTIELALSMLDSSRGLD
jgi:threonine synthase